MSFCTLRAVHQLLDRGLLARYQQEGERRTVAWRVLCPPRLCLHSGLLQILRNRHIIESYASENCKCFKFGPLIRYFVVLTT